MKKLLSILLSITMVISMTAFTTTAEDTSSLTTEEILNYLVSPTPDFENGGLMYIEAGKYELAGSNEKPVLNIYNIPKEYLGKLWNELIERNPTYLDSFFRIEGKNMDLSVDTYNSLKCYVSAEDIPITRFDVYFYVHDTFPKTSFGGNERYDVFTNPYNFDYVHLLYDGDMPDSVTATTTATTTTTTSTTTTTTTETTTTAVAPPQELTDTEVLRAIISPTPDFKNGGLLHIESGEYEIGEYNGKPVLRVYNIPEEYLGKPCEELFAENTSIPKSFNIGSCVGSGTIDESIDTGSVTCGIILTKNPVEFFRIELYVHNTLPSGYDDLVSASRRFDYAPYIFDELTPGDANGDGLISPVDAGLILSGYAATSTGEAQYLNKTIFDCDGDGIFSPRDASIALGYYSALSTLKPGTSLTWDEYLADEINS